MKDPLDPIRHAIRGWAFADARATLNRIDQANRETAKLPRRFWEPASKLIEPVRRHLASQLELERDQ